MAFTLLNRVQETATANTTVSFTLAGAVPGFQSFSAIGNGNTTYYSATDTAGHWEIGVGTYNSSGNLLVRTTPYQHTNFSLGAEPAFTGTVTVFISYLANFGAVFLDPSFNVSNLGNITSATWNATTIGVAYGGTGVTTSSGANSVVLRDANENITINRLSQGLQNITASGGVTTLTAASDFNQLLTGTGNHTFRLPDATTLTDTTAFQFNNAATGTLTIENNAGTAIGTVTTGGAANAVLISNATVGGTWEFHGYLPEGVTWGTNALNLGTTVISNGTWQGGTIQPAYGGTGLTTFTGANNALYSTSASALVAGTLPVAAGGTGLTSYTLNGVVYASGTGTLTTGSALTFDGTSLLVGSNTAGYGYLNVARYPSAPYASLTITDNATPANEVGVYLRATGSNPAGISTAGAPLAFYLGGAGGSEQMRLTTTGLGIGTNSPAYKLHVAGTGGFVNNGNENLFLADTVGATRSSLQMSGVVNYFNANIDSASHGQYIWRSSNAYTERMRLDASGNLGIGTNAPTAKLDVVSSSSGAVTEVLRLSNNGTGDGTQARVNFYAAATNYAQITGGYSGAPSLILNVASGGYQSWQINASEQMRLTSTGLGIGTSSPAAKIEGHYTSTAPSLSSSSGAGLSLRGSSSLRVNIGSDPSSPFGGWIQSSDNGGNAFPLNLNPLGGNVGIGTSSPANTLNIVKDNTAGRGQLSLQTSTAANFAQLTFYDRTTLGMQIYQGYQATAGLGDINIVNTGAAAIKFWTTNTDRMTIDSSGNLGIGTSSPSGYGNTSKLVIQTTSSTNGIVATFANSGSTGAAIQFFQNGIDTATIGMPAGLQGITFAPSGTTERMRLDSSGNLGIGTSSPATKLEVRDTNATGLFSNSATRYGYVQWENSGGEFRVGTDGAFGIRFDTNAQRRMTIDSSGNLGLGVTPSAWSASWKAFQVQRSAFSSISSSGTYVGYNWYNDGGNKYIATAVATLYEQESGAHRWYSAPSGTAGNAITFTQAMTLDASGNLLVGTTTYNGASNTAGFGANPVGQIAVERDGGAAGVFNRFSSDGQVVIFRRQGTTVGSIDVTTTATTYATSSDYRLKNTIAPMTGALAKVALLKPCTYKWNADGSDGEGFIAHELVEVVPQCVTGEKDAVDAEGKPVYQGIDTSFLVATLTAAIQELKAEVDSLKSQLKGA